MDLTLTISRSKVYDAVAQETVYIGGRSSAADVETYDKVFATDDDKQWLDIMFRDACSTLSLVLAEYATDATDLTANPADRGDYTMQLHLPDNVNAVTLSALPSDAHNYVVTSVLTDYLARLGLENAEIYKAQGSSLVETIVNKLSERKRPLYSEVVNERGEA